MKDSGVEWLGEVPAHWIISRIKFLATTISKGTTPTTVGANFVDSGIRFLKAENIADGQVSSEPEFFIDEETHKTLSRSALCCGDLLVVIAGATTGKSAVLKADLLPANTNQAVSFIRCHEQGMGSYLNLWLSTPEVQSTILLSSVQSAQPNLSMEDLGNIPIALPPNDERNRIVDSIFSDTHKLSGLLTEAQYAIDLLKERRSALISAAVTGKIDVRGLVENNPTEQVLEPA